MPSTAQIEAEQQRLYESGALRDDLNDDEAKVLLQWGEEQVVRLSEQVSDDDFEKQCRFLRQLIKSINRFVGQREFNERDGQLEYLGKVEKWLTKVDGFRELSADEVLAKLPEKSDMMSDLKTMLAMVSPAKSVTRENNSDVSTAEDNPNIDTEVNEAIATSITVNPTMEIITQAAVPETPQDEADETPAEKVPVTEFLPLDDEPATVESDNLSAEPSQPDSNFLSSLFNRLTNEDTHDEEE
ncbi:MAG: hypothetical protein ACPG7F_11965 [Aggregatilineales bacterium]